jgi:hypothetical protein
MRFLRPLLCRLGFHPRLQVIQSFGAAEHIGCPDCRREYAIHHGERASLPWDADFEKLYGADGFGYDIDGARQKWLAR